MAAPAVFDKIIPSSPAVQLPSGIGMPFLHEGNGRKKAGPVNSGRQVWKNEDRKTQQALHTICRVVAESVLPHALFGPKGLTFAATAVADFLVVLTNFFLIMNAGSTWQRVAHFNFAFVPQLAPGQMNIWGWLAVYGVLVTLLLHAEQDAYGTANRAQLNALIPGKAILWVTVLLSIV
ncbi:MAG TPA: hypothetical protein VGU64_20080, partial [Terriglobales bacterium]|nr:hypothetical protein [Terriglobales bacterium]